MLSTADN